MTVEVVAKIAAEGVDEAVEDNDELELTVLLVMLI